MFNEPSVRWAMKNLSKLKAWITDKLTSIQVWIITLPRKNWVSFHAHKLILNSKKQVKRGISERVSETWFAWMHPSRWRVSFSLALSLVILPQLLLGVLFRIELLPHQIANFIDTDFISTVWQVLASIIGISFVIIVFLTEYSHGRTYERRAFPVYVSATSMIFNVNLMPMEICLLLD